MVPVLAYRCDAGHGQWQRRVGVLEHCETFAQGHLRQQPTIAARWKRQLSLGLEQPDEVAGAGGSQHQAHQSPPRKSDLIFVLPLEPRGIPRLRPVPAITP